MCIRDSSGARRVGSGTHSSGRVGSSADGGWSSTPGRLPGWSAAYWGRPVRAATTAAAGCGAERCLSSSWSNSQTSTLLAYSGTSRSGSRRTISSWLREAVSTALASARNVSLRRALSASLRALRSAAKASRWARPAASSSACSARTPWLVWCSSSRWKATRSSCSVSLSSTTAVSSSAPSSASARAAGSSATLPPSAAWAASGQGTVTSQGGSPAAHASGDGVTTACSRPSSAGDPARFRVSTQVPPLVRHWRSWALRAVASLVRSRVGTP